MATVKQLTTADFAYDSQRSYADSGFSLNLGGTLSGGFDLTHDVSDSNSDYGQAKEEHIYTLSSAEQEAIYAGLEAGPATLTFEFEVVVANPDKHYTYGGAEYRIGLIFGDLAAWKAEASWQNTTPGGTATDSATAALSADEFTPSNHAPTPVTLTVTIGIAQGAVTTGKAIYLRALGSVWNYPS